MKAQNLVRFSMVKNWESKFNDGHINIQDGQGVGSHLPPAVICEVNRMGDS